MATGIIYVMTTVVDGLIKIGKTGRNNFEDRMYTLERNGYVNVTGLKRKFAIEVRDYHEKEKLLDEIFSKSKVPNTELYALELDLVIQLLSSFEGQQVYPPARNKEEIFMEAAEDLAQKNKQPIIPDGIYTLERKIKNFGTVYGQARVEQDEFTVLKGAYCAPRNPEWEPKARKEAQFEANYLMEDVVCQSPSTAAWIIVGVASNGWTQWRNDDGEFIDIYR